MHSRDCQGFVNHVRFDALNTCVSVGSWRARPRETYARPQTVSHALPRCNRRRVALRVNADACNHIRQDGDRSVHSMVRSLLCSHIRHRRKRQIGASTHRAVWARAQAALLSRVKPASAGLRRLQRSADSMPEMKSSTGPWSDSSDGASPVPESARSCEPATRPTARSCSASSPSSSTRGEVTDGARSAISSGA